VQIVLVLVLTDAISALTTLMHLAYFFQKIFIDWCVMEQSKWWWWWWW